MNEWMSNSTVTQTGHPRFKTRSGDVRPGTQDSRPSLETRVRTIEQNGIICGAHWEMCEFQGLGGVFHVSSNFRHIINYKKTNNNE